MGKATGLNYPPPAMAGETIQWILLLLALTGHAKGGSALARKNAALKTMLSACSQSADLVLIRPEFVDACNQLQAEFDTALELPSPVRCTAATILHCV